MTTTIQVPRLLLALVLVWSGFITQCDCASLLQQQQTANNALASSQGDNNDNNKEKGIINNHDNNNDRRETSTSGMYDVSALEHAPPPAPHKGRKNVLVTGAAGFVGSHTAEFLLRRGDRVIVLDEVNDYYDVSIKEANLKLLQEVGGSNIEIYRGDIYNATLVQHIFETERPSWVVHLAARAGVRPSILNPFAYIHSNIQGTTRLLDAAVKYGVTNFVMASSSSVYGGSKATLFDEHENVDFPISPYAASKRVTELLGAHYHEHYRLPITALRFFTVYGPRGRPDMAPFKFIDRMARGKTIQQFGDGSSSRDYTFVDDIVQGVVGALDRPAATYQNVNLGKGSGTSLAQFVELVAKYVGKEPHIEVLPDQPGDVPYTCANVTRAHTMLDYTPTIPFETGIEKTVEWYKESYPYDVPSTNNKKAQKKNDQGKNKRAQKIAQKFQDDEKTMAEHRRLQEDDKDEVRHLRRRLQTTKPHTNPKNVLVVAEQESALLTKRVVDALTSRGDSVALIVPTSSMHTTLDASDYSFDDMSHVSVHTGCVDNATFLEHVMEQEKPSWIAYLNSLSNATESKQDPYTFTNVNTQAFVRLLEVARKHKVDNLVVTSSTAVYESTNVWHSETETIPTFASPFAISQKARELFGHTWHHLYGIPMTALRIPLVYGPGCHWCGQQDGMEMDQVQEYMFVDDAAEGIIRALDRPHPYQIINLGQGPDFVEEACQSRSSLKEMMLAHLQGNFFSTTVARPCALARVDKAQALLDFSPQVRLREGIRRVAAWFREHPDQVPPEFLQAALDAREYPPLPWETHNLEKTVGSAESSLPQWVEILAQVQWVLVAIFLVWKLAATWGSRSEARKSS